MAGTPFYLKNTRGVLGLLGGVYWGRSPVPEMKNGRGPFTQKREEKKKKKRKRKKGRELEKTLASSKILTHGLGSLKGSPQCERKKKEKKSTAQRRSRCLDLISSIISIEVKVKVNGYGSYGSYLTIQCPAGAVVSIRYRPR
jgi:hypothetical protein